MLVAGLAGQKKRALHRVLLSSQSLDTAPGGAWEGPCREVARPKSRASARESMKQTWLLSTGSLDRRPEALLIPELCPGFLSSSNALSTGTSIAVGTHDCQAALVKP